MKGGSVALVQQGGKMAALQGHGILATNPDLSYEPKFAIFPVAIFFSK